MAFGIEIKNLSQVCVELINLNISFFWKKAGLIEYPDTKTYYFKSVIKSKYHSSSLPIKLSGNRRENYWHYGLDSYFVNTPVIGIIIRWHIIFTDKNGNNLPERSQFSQRRSKGKSFFNKQWRNLLLGTMYYLSNGANWINIASCCDNSSLMVSATSVEFVSPVGFDEPVRNVGGGDEEESDIY